MPSHVYGSGLRIVKAIIKDLQEDDYEESLDSEEPTPTPPSPRGRTTTDLDMNTILDKIFKIQTKIIK